jgi:hypothetical protein
VRLVDVRRHRRPLIKGVARSAGARPEMFENAPNAAPHRTWVVAVLRLILVVGCLQIKDVFELM